MQTPAEIVIKKLGGHKAVAKALKVHLATTYRWTHPKKSGGTGGRVPGVHQEKLLTLAKKKGIDLTPSDFFTRAA
jgi:hypothetical protein